MRDHHTTNGYVRNPKACDFFTELEEDCNTFTDDFTARNVLLGIWLHSSSHGDNSSTKAQVSLPRARSRIKVPRIGGFTARMARYLGED